MASQRLPLSRTSFSQFLQYSLKGQILTREPGSWSICSRTLKNGREPRLFTLWEKLWECQSTPSGELMLDESWSGDFIGDGDLIPLTHQETKMDCQEYSELWADPTSCACGVQWGWGRRDLPWSAHRWASWKDQPDLNRKLTFL